MCKEYLCHHNTPVNILKENNKEYLLTFIQLFYNLTLAYAYKMLLSLPNELSFRELSTISFFNILKKYFTV
jgi:hypothetical protein